MPAIKISRDGLLTLAGLTHVRHVRIALHAMERADVSGVAVFDDGELAELCGIDPRMSASGKWLKPSEQVASIIKSGMLGDVFLPGARRGRITLNTATFTPLADGVRALLTMDGERVLGECDVCQHRAVFAISYVESGLARCSRCKAVAA